MKSKKFLIIVMFFLIETLISNNISYSVDKAEKNEISEKYKQWIQLSEEERKGTIAPLPFNVAAKNSIGNSIDRFLFRVRGNEDETIPEKYDLRDKVSIEVKNQQSTGTCWAMSATSNLELFLALKNENYNFSERHMEYDTVSAFSDGINERGLNRWVGAGGYASTAFTYFSRGSGPILEEDMPFENNQDLIPLSELPTNVAVKKVDDMVYLPIIYKEKDANGRLLYKDANENEYSTETVEYLRKQTKEFIMKNGSISASVLGANSLEDNQKSSYIEKSVDDTAFPNHKVTIIGWDDNYSKNNFNYNGNKPSHNGAYIVLNSWGSEWGNGGYYYISYEDAFIECSLAGVLGTSDIQYDNLYQHDTSEIFGYEEGKYAANVFTCEENETIKELMIGSTNEQKCNIYINPINDDLDITKLEAVKTGVQLKPGYSTVKLDEGINIKKGNKFAVIVEIYEYDTYEGIGAEFNIDGELSNAKSNEGESFISDDGINWRDLYDENMPENLSIKAYTQAETESVEVSEFVGEAYEGCGGEFKYSISTSYLEKGNDVNIKLYKDGTEMTEKTTLKNNTIRGNGAYITLELSDEIEAGEYNVDISLGEFEPINKTFEVKTTPENSVFIQFEDSVFMNYISTIMENALVNPYKKQIITTNEEIEKVTKIELRDIKDITGIESFYNLHELDINNQDTFEHIDISLISNLNKLEILRLNNIYINSNLSFILPLQNLKELSLDNIYIKEILDEDYEWEHKISDNDLIMIGSLSNLEKLSIRVAWLNSITSILQLNNLRELDLGYNSLVTDEWDSEGNRCSVYKSVDITGISSLNNLEILKLDGNSIEHLSEISNLTKLKHLRLGGYDSQTQKLEEFGYGNCMLDIDTTILNNLSNLETLELTFIPSLTEEKLQNLNKLNKLKNLNLQSCNIGNLEFINGLDLEKLIIGNGLESILVDEDHPIPEWIPEWMTIGTIGLVEYPVGDNHIEDLNPISNMTNLKYLDMDYMKSEIHNLNDLENLNKLEYINCTHNAIRDASGIEGKNIKYYNRINTNGIYVEDNRAESNLSHQKIEDTFAKKDGEDLIINIPKILEQIIDENSSIHNPNESNPDISLENCEWNEYGKSIIIKSNNNANVIHHEVGEGMMAGNGVVDVRYYINIVNEEELQGDITGIKVKNMPKTYYKSDEELSIEDGLITVEYENGKSVDVFMTDENITISGYDKTKGGKQEITISYKGVSTQFEVIQDKTIPEYEVPTGIVALYGDTLEKITLPEGFEWENDLSTQVGKVGNNVFTCKYTPDDTNRYTIVEGIEVTVKVIEKLNIELKDELELKDEYLTKINPNSTIDDLIEGITTNGEIKVFDVEGNEIQNNIEKIKTGMKVKVYTELESEEYILIITGDVTGDGKANIKDILQINKHRLNKIQLYDYKLTAGDVNNDNIVNIKDILIINKYRLGIINTF